MEKIKRNVLFVALAIAFFIIIKVDFNQTIMKFSIILPLLIILMTQLYFYLKIKRNKKQL